MIVLKKLKTLQVARVPMNRVHEKVTAVSASHIIVKTEKSRGVFSQRLQNAHLIAQ